MKRLAKRNNSVYILVMGHFRQATTDRHMENSKEYKSIKPDNTIADFVERTWLFQNSSADNNELIALPDGRIDIIFTLSPNEPFRIGIVGIETKPSKNIFAAGTVMFGVSLKLLAVEYLLDITISHLVDALQLLPNNFWGINQTDLHDFDRFCKKVSDHISRLLKPYVDNRKKKLFDLIYSSNGSMTVKELSEKVFWSSRQINRYFNQQFGISLKTYCNILRFRASFPHIKEGKLFPKQNFADQAHFIREVKKLSGATPKELFKNQNDRFIQFSTLL